MTAKVILPIFEVLMFGLSPTRSKIPSRPQLPKLRELIIRNIGTLIVCSKSYLF